MSAVIAVLQGIKYVAKPQRWQGCSCYIAGKSNLGRGVLRNHVWVQGSGTICATACTPNRHPMQRQSGSVLDAYIASQASARPTSGLTPWSSLHDSQVCCAAVAFRKTATASVAICEHS